MVVEHVRSRSCQILYRRRERLTFVLPYTTMETMRTPESHHGHNGPPPLEALVLPPAITEIVLAAKGGGQVLSQCVVVDACVRGWLLELLLAERKPLLRRWVQGRARGWRVAVS